VRVLPLDGSTPPLSLLDDVRAQRRTVYERLRVLADAAATEQRAFTDDEQRSWDELNGELTKFDERIGQLAGQEQRARDAEAAMARYGGAGSYHRPQNAELRSFLLGEPGAPRTFEVRPSGPIDVRTLSKLTAGAGANTVPTSFYDRLVAHMIDVAQVLQYATVLNTSGGESLQIPKTTAHSSAAIVTEGASIAASDPAFGQVTLGSYKYGLLIQVSRELVDDSGVDLEGYLSQQAGRALGNAFGAHAITGTGTAQPRGITIDSALGVTGGAGAAPTADQLISLFHSVLPAYRNSPSAAWIMRDATWAAIKQLKASGTGEYVVGNLADTTDQRLLGKPVIIDATMPAVGASAKSVVFGDLSAYYARIAGGIRFERSDDFAFGTDLVSYRALMRADGALVDTSGAVKHYASA
jgi:HK97 family phage major capsid protein